MSGSGPSCASSTTTTASTGRPAGDDIVKVHWYEGDAAFGAKALELGEDAVRETSELLGVTETEPIDFFVYANVDDFYGAHRSGRPRERRGLGVRQHPDPARAHPAAARSTTPLVAVRIPHEFVHLVFDTASQNPYHSPPRWLNEGLAVYQSEGYGSSDRGAGRGVRPRTARSSRSTG